MAERNHNVVYYRRYPDPVWQRYWKCTNDFIQQSVLDIRKEYGERTAVVFLSVPDDMETYTAVCDKVLGELIQKINTLGTPEDMV